MQEIVRLADTLVLMSHGRIEAVGPLEELTSRLELRPLTGRYDAGAVVTATVAGQDKRSEEHTSELQSLMRSSYAVFCLKKKKTHDKTPDTTETIECRIRREKNDSKYENNIKMQDKTS